MLTKNHIDAWADFISYVEERCSATEFQNWIAPIQVIDSTPDEMKLQVPNIFVQEYLLENYKKDLIAFLPVRENGELAIHFVVGKEAEKKKTISPPPEETKDNLKLNSHYTFQNFIEGPSNQFAKSAALGVAAQSGKSYNPLFIHGGVGLGKTHLLHAIGHHIKQHHKRVRIQCITTEEFINDIVHHLKGKSIDHMKRYYRSLDILLIDDIQFLQHRLNFEEEFCNTFETLVHQNKQVVITSDKPPIQLKLSQRLVARMEWGLVAQIGAPDLETRVAILQHKAELKGFRLPSKVALFIAEHIFNNVRQLEGAINRLLAYSQVLGTQILGKEVTEELAHYSLGELFQYQSQKKVSVEQILKAVASLFGVRTSDLRGSSRAKAIAFARQVAMYLAKELVADSWMKLASSFGGKRHSTLLHAWKKIASQLEKDETLRQQLQMVRKNLEE